MLHRILCSYEVCRFLALASAVRQIRGMDKRSYLGMAGHHMAMAEFLYRGYNVAIPAVDIGDDVYIVEDLAGTMWRLQVKTADQLQGRVATYQLSRKQLGKAKANELFYMFMVRGRSGWRFLLIARRQLFRIRRAFENADRSGRHGRKPTVDGQTTSDSLSLRIEWRPEDARGWDASFAPYLDRWPAVFPERSFGPGAVRSSVPSPDRRTGWGRAPQAAPRRAR